ncbi:MAG: transaldolase [Gaiellales bacterium]|nr:MAG: transaldolase [Gaiellales bacterium]
MGNSLQELHGSAGQSIWVDYLGRDLLGSGELKRLIEEDSISGVTSNPSIFRKAISGSALYDDMFRARLDQGVVDERELFFSLAIEDVGAAADLLLPVYEKSGGTDGYVSIEVSPDLAHETDATIEEARRIFRELGRKNILIKVPGTSAGIPAIEQLISEGVNVNVTLLFSTVRYEEIAWAFVQGLERRAQAGEPVDHIFSVASFFISRVDTLVDRLLSEKIEAEGDSQEELKAMLGQAAVANAKVAWLKYKPIFEGDRFASLAVKGASPQRLLWASTSTKNPDYSDIKYVEELIAPATINTLPAETIAAFADHGNPRVSIDEGLDEAAALFDRLAAAGVDIEQAAKQLEDEGVKAFSDDFFALLEEITRKREALLAGA